MSGMTLSTLQESFSLKVSSVSWAISIRSSIQCQAKYLCCGPITTLRMPACLLASAGSLVPKRRRKLVAYSTISTPSACISWYLSPPTRRLFTLAISPTSDADNVNVCTTRPVRGLGDRPAYSSRCCWYPSRSTIIASVGVLLAVESGVNHTD